MADEEFLMPGVFDPFYMGNEATLHQGGLDFVQVARDPSDDFGAQIPQLGPSFESYVTGRYGGDKLVEYYEKVLGKWSYEPTTTVLFASMQADANGNIGRGVQANSLLFETPGGFTFALHRITVRNGVNNFGNPFSAAGAYWELRVGDEPLDGGSLVAGQGSFPVVKSWGDRDALRVRDGEVLSLFVVGTAALANQQIVVRGQGTLERNPEG